MPEIGIAASIRVKHLCGGADITPLLNNWLSENPDLEIIDIKFATSATEEEWSTDVLIVYRKETY